MVVYLRTVSVADGGIDVPIGIKGASALSPCVELQVTRVDGFFFVEIAELIGDVDGPG